MMYIKKYWFWFAIMAILISWTVNTWYFKSKQIDAPIFLTHYIEESIGNPTFLTLYYITNKSDHKDLQVVKLDDLLLYPQQHDGFIYMDSDQLQRQNVHQEFTHHYIRKTTFEINKDLLSPQHLKDGIDVKNIEAIFSERAPMTVPIGHIRLLPPVAVSNVLQSVSSSSSSAGDNRIVYSANEPLSIEKIDLPFDQKVKGLYEIEFMKNPISTNGGQNKTANQELATEWPIELETRERFISTIQINMKSKSMVSLQFMIKGKTRSEKSFQIPFHAAEEPFLTQSEVNSYINNATEVR